MADGDGRWALITGASSGLGLALAHEFARHGFAVALTARRTARLADAARDITGRYKVPTHTMTADLAAPDAVPAVMQSLEAAGIVPDALVNNAGYAVPGRFFEPPWSEHRNLLEVLLVAPLALTYAVLPGMRAKGYGRILNIASLAAFTPAVIGGMLYPAAKSFLVHASQSLALELAGTGIHVTAVCPGFTHTEFHNHGLREDVARLPKALWMDAEPVARQSYRAVMRGQTLLVNGWHNQLAAGLLKHLPNRVMLTIARRFFRAEHVPPPSLNTGS